MKLWKAVAEAHFFLICAFLVNSSYPPSLLYQQPPALLRQPGEICSALNRFQNFKDTSFPSFLLISPKKGGSSLLLSAAQSVDSRR